MIECVSPNKYLISSLVISIRKESLHLSVAFLGAFPVDSRHSLNVRENSLQLSWFAAYLLLQVVAAFITAAWWISERMPGGLCPRRPQ